MAYSYQKSWTNGLTFFLWVLSWLRSHGVTVPIVFTVDRGEEFGASLIQNHVASPQENAHVERSHRTDDEEFYIPRLLSIPSKFAFFQEAMNYLYYYNTVRKHSALGRVSPWAHLLSSTPDLDAKISFVPPILLDNLAVQLGDWSGYHLMASHLSSSDHVQSLQLVRYNTKSMPRLRRKVPESLFVFPVLIIILIPGIFGLIETGDFVKTYGFRKPLNALSQNIRFFYIQGQVV